MPGDPADILLAAIARREFVSFLGSGEAGWAQATPPTRKAYSTPGCVPIMSELSTPPPTMYSPSDILSCVSWL